MSSDEIIRTHRQELVPLSKAERRTVSEYFDRGIGALFDLHMGPLEIADFLSRPEVEDELKRLASEFDDRKQTVEKMRHRTRLELGKLAPAAIQVLQRMLIGNVRRVDPETGEEEVLAAPDKGQFDAAREVLKNLGVEEKIQDVGDADMSVYVDNRQINITGELATDTTSAAQSREKIRAVVDSILSDARRVAKEQNTPLEDTDKPRKKRKKKKRKKRAS